MEAIRLFREKEGLTQRELAARAGVRQPHISRWETAEVEPTRPNLEKLARALGVLPWELHYAEQLIQRREAVEATVAMSA